MKLEDLTWMPERTKKAHAVVRKYDVRITLNKSGDNRQVIRFGFLNKGAEVFEKYKYIEVSDVESKKCPNRIYFRAETEKTNSNMHKLCTNGKSKTKNLYTSLTPTGKGDKIYRSQWINGTFKIKLDDECGLYYIENAKE